MLTSSGALPVTNLGSASPAGLSTPVNLAAGQIKAYQFTVPVGTQSLDVRLENRTGSPSMRLVSGTRLPLPPANGGAFHQYGHDGGSNGQQDESIITVPNPATGIWSMLVRADGINSSNFPDATASLVIRQKQNVPLNFAASQNSGGGTHTDTRQMIDDEYTIYQVVPPAALGGEPVLGWIIDTDVLQGAVSLQVYRNFADPTSGTTINDSFAVIVPPFLTFGDTWYVRVRATGLTNYTITSRAVTLERPLWQMPAAHNVTFGDSGNDSAGNPLPGDRGVDLAQGEWHFYSIDVPAGNLGLLRTELRAISGNPDLYIREDGVPTTTHSAPNGANLYHRRLNGSVTEYGNWVPLDGRTERQLRPGRWYLGVRAGGNSNVRYRLIASTGQVQDLALNGDSATSQTLAGNDWRYYRFSIPADAPNNWTLTFSQQVGDVVMYLRDTVPPGQNSTNDTGGSIESWYYDNKNQGPYSSGDDAAGSYPNTTPPLRPGHTYYVGFRSNNSATFSISGGTTGVPPVIAFYGGTANTSIPANSSVIYQIPVPIEGTRLKWTSTHASSVSLRLEQGTLPATAGPQHYISSGANSSFNQTLSANPWPWQPNQTYCLRVVNTSASTQAFSINIDGRNAQNEDEDRDGLADAWELRHFAGSLFYNGTHDNDTDGGNNGIEFAFNMNPRIPDARPLTPGTGTSGLPFFRLVGTGAAAHLECEFLRRKGAGLTYTVQFANSPAGPWQPATAAPTVTPINADFERVIVPDTATVATTANRFGRVMIALP